MEAHNSVWTGDRAVEFIKDHSQDRPFFLFASFQDPHHPHALPKGFENPVDRSLVPAPSFKDGELEDKPPHFKLAREGKLEGSRFVGEHWDMSGQGKGADFRMVSEEAALDGRAQYYGMVSLIDQQLLRIWAALEECGEFENTLIIVTSDHGELLGDHGLWMKGPFHYEQVVRVPMLVKVPQIMNSQVTKEWEYPVSLVDIPATCLQAAGLPEGDEQDGQSLLTPDINRSVMVETIQDWHALKCLSVITYRYKLTCYPGEDFGELVDLIHDEGEAVNLYAEDFGPSETLMKLMLGMQHDGIRSHKSRIGYA